MRKGRRQLKHLPRQLAGLGVFVSALVGLPNSVAAQIDVGAVASTQGAGIEVATALSPGARARFSVLGLSYDDDFTAGSVPYQASADLKWAEAILDWSPGGGVFHVSVGAVFNGHTIDGSADILDVAVNEFGQQDVDEIIALLPPGTEIGTLNAEVSFNPVSPYLGIGWRSRKAAGLGAAFDLGVIWLGEAEATVTVRTGLPLNLIPGIDDLLSEFLREQEREIEREAEDYELFPVARLTVFFRF